MAKFSADFGVNGADFTFTTGKGDALTTDDLLEVLRPAAMRLKEHFRNAIVKRFKQRTGSLADSIDFEEDYLAGSFVSFMVKPFGKHKTGKRTRKSRAGSPLAKGAKHNRSVKSSSISNMELGYLLEYGTPRIQATHWMETANEEIAEELQTMIDENFTELLKKKGLI